jgi:hypothetical protein
MASRELRYHTDVRRLGRLLAVATITSLIAAPLGFAAGPPDSAVPPVPGDLWVVPFNSGRAAEMVLAETLQGLTGHDLPKLWLDKNGVMSAVVLQQLQDEGTNVHRVASVWELPDDFWLAVDGAIVYTLGTHSLNVAISLCGLWNAVAVDESVLSQAQEKGLLVLYDARGQTEDQIFDQYQDLFSAHIAVEQTETKPAYLRDFAVQNNAFTFYGFDSTFRRRVAEALGPGTTIFGWGPSEYTWISDFSRSSSQGVAADWCVNLSALSRLPVDIPGRAHLPPAAAEEGQRIVAFVLSDGDNVQWLTGGMPLDAKYFASPRRGQFTMNWEISPLLAGLAPRVLKYFFDNATDQDDFVAAGSPGYRYIHFEQDQPRGATDAAQTAPYLDAGHLSVVSVINDNGGGLNDVIPLLDLPEVDGVVYKAYAPYTRLHGEMLCHQDDSGASKFAVSYKFLLWENMAGASPGEVASAIAGMPGSPQSDRGSYALINAHAWSWGSLGGPVEAVSQTIDRLPPNTRVVSLNDFFALLGQNFDCNGVIH